MNNKLAGYISALSCGSVLFLSAEDDLNKASTEIQMTSKKESFGMVKQKQVSKFTLVNKHGMKAVLSEYGATLLSLDVPDRDGNLADVTLGYDSLNGWLSNTSYFGSTVGRYANRIADGKFSLNGKVYTLAKNNEPGGIRCHLHGGDVGLDKVLWNAEAVTKPSASGVVFSYSSPDGEEGYPGNLDIKVTYWLTDNNELIWEAAATTDKATPVNLVHHSYWNLSGDSSKPITDHTLKLEADHYLPTTVGLIPTGKIAPVASTPMDFTVTEEIGSRIDTDYEALKFGGGYDHCWVLRETKSELALAATLTDPKSGRQMQVFSNQPGIQFYSGNFLDGTVIGKKGATYQHRTGLCLETQKFPDGPNQVTFPNTILKPGETYQHTMVHRFSIEK